MYPHILTSTWRIPITQAFCTLYAPAYRHNVSDWLTEWTDERVNKWVSEKKSKWTRKIMNERVNEWMKVNEALNVQPKDDLIVENVCLQLSHF